MSFDNSVFTEPQSAEDKALTFELSGHEVGWLADALAIERAKDRGAQLGEILGELQKLDEIEDAASVEEAANRFADMYPAIARLVWFGMLRFNEDVSFEAILGAIDNDSLEELPLEEMMDRIFPDEDEQLPEGEGK